MRSIKQMINEGSYFKEYGQDMFRKKYKTSEDAFNAMLEDLGEDVILDQFVEYVDEFMSAEKDIAKFIEFCGQSTNSSNSEKIYSDYYDLAEKMSSEDLMESIMKFLSKKRLDNFIDWMACGLN